MFGFPLFTAPALHSLSSAHGAVIVGLLPAATAVAAVLFAAERPSGAFWAASSAGLVAVLVFAAAQGAGVPSAADGLVLIAVAFGALGYAKGGALSRELGGWQTICWALVLSLPLTLPVTLVAGLAGDLSGGSDAGASLLLGEHLTPGMVAASLIVLACVVATQRTRVDPPTTGHGSAGGAVGVSPPQAISPRPSVASAR